MSRWPSFASGSSSSSGGATGLRTSRADTRVLVVRVLASLALLCLAGTYVAVEIDFLRRHHPGIAPERYWTPQAIHVLVPGLGVAALLGAVAFVLERGRRRT